MPPTLRRTIAATFLLAGVLLPAVGPTRPIDQHPARGWGAGPASAAPARMGVDGLAFSADVDGQANPIDGGIEFSSSTERVWTSFAYRDYGGESMTYLVRANGDDWHWGDLDCCEGQNGRFAFPIERRSGNDLGGAAYDVLVYANGAEVARAGFGVRGTRGFDSDGSDNGNGNGNDNTTDNDND
jgi:hypothetical protein